MVFDTDDEDEEVMLFPVKDEEVQSGTWKAADDGEANAPTKAPLRRIEKF